MYKKKIIFITLFITSLSVVSSSLIQNASKIKLSNRGFYITKDKKLNLKKVLVVIPLHQYLLNQKNIPQLSSKRPDFSVITSTTESPPSTSTIPSDLLQLANRLGITNVNDIPDLDLIGGFLGTTSRQDTIQLIQDMASTEDGMQTIKNYLQVFNENRVTQQDEMNSESTTLLPDTEYNNFNASNDHYVQPSDIPIAGNLIDRIHTNYGILANVISTPSPDLGFFNRIISWSSYFKSRNNTPIDLSKLTNDNAEESSKITLKTIPVFYQPLKQFYLYPIPLTNPISFVNSFPLKSTTLTTLPYTNNTNLPNTSRISI